MSKIKKYLSSLKLSQKLTLLIIATIGIPLFVLSMLFFQSIKMSKIKDRIKNIEIDFTQNYAQIQKTVEMCSLSTQIVINSQSFWNDLIRFCQEDDWKTEELLYFYHNDIKAFEKLVNSNPYLYQIRIYVDSDEMQEMMPILYRKERMKRLSWAKYGDYESGRWYFDYEDTIFPNYVINTEKHIASLITKIDKEIPATIEIATRMDMLFPNIYSSNEEDWTCFIDENGYYYYNDEYYSRWLKSTDVILKDMKDKLGDGNTMQTTIDGVPVIICYKPMKEFDGHLLRIISLEKDFATVNQQQRNFWMIFVCIVIILIFLTNKVLELILRQFYATIGTIRMVQHGDLSVRVPIKTKDEIGELGQQINTMLDRISELMDESIKRELLVKDSEIRALQNQINAHFIYNVLESIKMMAEIEEKYSISDAVTSLGKLLRYSMKWVSKNVTVAEEVEYIKDYLALINLRFDYEIYLSLNIPERIYEQEIPKMSLQPIIENAIYHGIEGIAEDTNIYIKGIIHGDYCTIEITDAGRGMTEEEVEKLKRKIEGVIETRGSSGNGIGLKNVQDRIKISFGDEYGISLASKLGCYTKVIVKIPFE
ncbi:MAG: histidine kinase [Clostridiales bacterium]|nr:histidine kinase [Clostridiales bacterium]